MDFFFTTFQDVEVTFLNGTSLNNAGNPVKAADI
jgi:hypothetical protein